jgi:hypothetical protein
MGLTGPYFGAVAALIELWYHNVVKSKYIVLITTGRRDWPDEASATTRRSLGVGIDEHRSSLLHDLLLEWCQILQACHCCRLKDERT